VLGNQCFFKSPTSCRLQLAMSPCQPHRLGNLRVTIRKLMGNTVCVSQILTIMEKLLRFVGHFDWKYSTGAEAVAGLC
jgi:hypothetical protein